MDIQSITKEKFTYDSFFQNKKFFFDEVKIYLSDTQYENFVKFINISWLKQLCFSEMVAYFAYTELSDRFNADYLKNIAQEELLHSVIFKKIYVDIYNKPYTSVSDQQFKRRVLSYLKESGELNALIDFYIRELRLLAILKQVHRDMENPLVRDFFKKLLAEESKHTHYIINIIKTQYEQLPTENKLEINAYYQKKIIEHVYWLLPEIKKFFNSQESIIEECYSGQWFKDFQKDFQKKLSKLNNVFNVSDIEIKHLITNTHFGG